MPKTKAQIIAEAQVVKNATEVGENTATRVGGVLEDLADADSVVIIPVTGTSSGGNITLSSNPFMQVQTAVNAGQHVVVRVTIASDIIDFTMNTYSASVATYIGTANFLENEFQLLCNASSAVITNRSTSNTFSTGESVPNVGIDATPTQGSDNLVKSGGVAIQTGVCGLENGSYSNKWSAVNIRATVMPTNGAKYVTVYTNRPNTEGCLYSYGVIFTSSLQDIGKIYVKSSFVGYVSDYSPNSTTIGKNIIEVPDGVVGVGFMLTEYNGTTQHALRVSDFDGYQVLFYTSNIDDYFNAYNSMENFANKMAKILSPLKKEYFTNNKTAFVDLSSIAVGNTYSINIALTASFTYEIIDVQEGQMFNLTTKSNTASAKSYAILDKNNVVLDFRQASASNLTLIMPTSAAKLIVNTATTSSGYFLKGMVDGYISTERNVSLIDAVWNSKEYKVINGSQGNKYNAWVVTAGGADTIAIPVEEGHTYRLRIGYEIQDGYNYYYRLVTYSTENPTNLYSNKIRDLTSQTKPITEDIVIGSGEQGMSIQITALTSASASQTTGQCEVLRDYMLNGKLMLVDVTVGEIQSPMCERNKDRTPMLINSCRLHKESLTSKDFNVTICTDSHGWTLAVSNAVAATNGFDVIDAFVHCGDIAGRYYADTTQITECFAQLDKLAKPAYVVCGNHDVGNCYYVGYACDHVQAYTTFIKPMVDKGWLINGEYEANKPYWYHDNATYKVRIIGLYEYDDNLDLNETYWKAVAYDSTAPTIAFNTAYSVGAKVNAHNYVNHSFECVQNVTTPANYYTNPEKLPSYKVWRGVRVIRQTEAQWFLNVMATTPANYGVVVVMHNPFSDNAVSLDKKFSWPANTLGSRWSQNGMQTDFIRNAIVAFKNHANYTEKVVMKGDAAYLNTLNSGGVTYSYEVSKNFSSVSSGVYFIGILGGHSHKDLIFKDSSENVYQVTPNCAVVDSANDMGGDVRRTRGDGLCADSLTIAALADGRIGLVKLGVNVTDRGTFRDYEVLDTTI